jgi:Predicted membrane protein
MSINASTPLWQSAAVLVGRLIFAGIFLMATSFKFLGMAATASYIAAAGFPAPLLLAWVAAIFEALLAICFLTGAFFTEAALLAAAYVLFLAFAFMGPRIGRAIRRNSASSSIISPSSPDCCSRR